MARKAARLPLNVMSLSHKVLLAYARLCIMDEKPSRNNILGMQNCGQVLLAHVLSVHVALVNFCEEGSAASLKLRCVKSPHSPAGIHADLLLQHILTSACGSHGTSSFGWPFG